MRAKLNCNYFFIEMNLLLVLKSRVAMRIIFNADPGPDPAFHFTADADPNVHFNAVPYPARSDANLRLLVYSPSRALLRASKPPL